MTQQTLPFDGQPLLDAFRELNTSTREALVHVDPEYSADYHAAAARMSATSAAAADAAEAALRDLDAGDPT